jgi:hypothetical protein
LIGTILIDQTLLLEIENTEIQNNKKLIQKNRSNNLSNTGGVIENNETDNRMINRRTNDKQHADTQTVTTNSDLDTEFTNQNYRGSNTVRTRPRVLMGVFTTARNTEDLDYRNMYRRLLDLFYPRICSLHEFQVNATIRESCEVIYTFVIGAALPEDGSAPPIIVDNTTDRPLIVPNPYISTELNQSIHDLSNPDMTFLNIR